MTNNKIHKLVLAFGILAPITYILTDIVTGLITPGYSFFAQTVSELSAIGAPTKNIWVFMSFVFNPLLILFGAAIVVNAKNKMLLKITGWLIVVQGILGFAWLFFPMNLRGNIGSTNDSMHLVMVVVTVILMIVMILTGANTFDKKFRYYSIATLLIMAIFGIITGQQTSRVAAGLPTPWMGITERISSYSPYIWMAILAFNLLKINGRNRKVVTK